MNKIDKLIKELCPNGVEWKELGKVCEVIRGKRLTRKELMENGEYPVFHGGLIPLGYYNKYNRKGNKTMVINTGSVGEVVYSFIDFWSSDGTFTIETPNNLLDRFVYYSLKCKEAYLKTQRREGGVPTISREVIEKLLIPVPPLPIQQEIVNILDKFTALEAELQAELEARRKQYEYYREKLLTFSELDSKSGGVKRSESASYVEWKTLSDVCVFSQGIQVDLNLQFYEADDNRVRFLRIIDFTQGNQEPRYIEKVDSKYFISKDDIAMVRYGEAGFVCTGKSGVIANNLFKITPKSNTLNKRYLYYTLMSNLVQKPIKNSIKPGALPAVSFKMFNRISIPIPQLSEQERIVFILDKFEEMVNKSLPEEIELRRKQYEYYREKLLTFN